MSQSSPLIVGAGPVGLGAAVYLAQAGIETRIIDKAEKASQESRALAVNPRTLEILDGTGVTEKMLQLGLPLPGARFSQPGQHARELWFNRNLRHKYPFMLALSQATTERLLAEAFEKAGGKIERGVELIGCHNEGQKVVAELRHCSTNARETVYAPWLLAADGAHSTARKALDIDFPGDSFEKPWYLADLPLSTRLEENMAHAFFPRHETFIFFIRVVDDVTKQPKENPLWRVISPQESTLEEIAEAKAAGPPVWKSDFHISHRINRHFQVGNVFFAGDAAHIHSPIGARGMNLGLEDAFVFSQLVRSNQMQRYEGLRKSVDERVVKRIKLMSRVVLGQTTLTRFMRSVLLNWLMRISLFRRQFIKTATGLDHPLEF